MHGDKERKAMAEWKAKRLEEERQRRANKSCGNCGFCKDGECGYWDIKISDNTDVCRKWR